MPPIEVGEHLLGYLYECGPTLVAGMGEGPLTHSEIEAWQRNSGVDLEPWEAQFMRRLSIEYLSQSHKSSVDNCQPPWNSDVLKAAAAQSLRESIEVLTKL